MAACKIRIYCDFLKSFMFPSMIYWLLSLYLYFPVLVLDTLSHCPGGVKKSTGVYPGKQNFQRVHPSQPTKKILIGRTPVDWNYKLLLGCELDYPNFTGVHPGRPLVWHSSTPVAMSFQNPLGHPGAPWCTRMHPVTPWCTLVYPGTPRYTPVHPGAPGSGQ